MEEASLFRESTGGRSPVVTPSPLASKINHIKFSGNAYERGVDDAVLLTGACLGDLDPTPQSDQNK